jgi:hypothetical protein
MAAAVATSHVENNEAAKQQYAAKRKRDKEKFATAPLSSSLSSDQENPRIIPIQPFIGQTKVEHVAWSANGLLKTQFLPPVQLAQLGVLFNKNHVLKSIKILYDFLSARRKQRAPKRLIPLIEPDICNSFILNFMPEALFNLVSSSIPSTLSIQLQQLELLNYQQQQQQQESLQQYQQAQQEQLQQQQQQGVDRSLYVYSASVVSDSNVETNPVDRVDLSNADVYYHRETAGDILGVDNTSR